MANMTSSQYQVVADVIAQAKIDVELQKNKFAEERGGEHELTTLQYISILSARTTLASLGDAMKKAFSDKYPNFNEDRFNKAIGYYGIGGKE